MVFWFRLHKLCGSDDLIGDMLGSFVPEQCFYKLLASEDNELLVGINCVDSIYQRIKSTHLIYLGLSQTKQLFGPYLL